MTIALAGDLRFAGQSTLVQTAGIVRIVQFSLVSPEALRLLSDYIEFMRSRSSGHGDLKPSRGDQSSDIVYVTRTQEERFDSP